MRRGLCPQVVPTVWEAEQGLEWNEYAPRYMAERREGTTELLWGQQQQQRPRLGTNTVKERLPENSAFMN